MARETKRQPQISAETLAKLPPLPTVGELDSVAQLRTEWARVYRGRARGQITPGEARDLLYALQVGLAIMGRYEQFEWDRLLYAEARRIDAEKSGRVIDGTTRPAEQTSLPAPSETTSEVEIASPAPSPAEAQFADTSPSPADGEGPQS